MPLIRIRDVGSPSASTWYSGDWDKAHLVKRGDLVVGMDGDFRVSRWMGEDSLLNQRVCKIEVDEAKYNSRFLELALPGYLNAIHSATSSITVKHLSSRSIADIPLPLPERDEQRRIVQILDDHLSRLDAAVGYLDVAWRLGDRLVMAAFRAFTSGADRAASRMTTLADVATWGSGELPEPATLATTTVAPRPGPSSAT